MSCVFTSHMWYKYISNDIHPGRVDSMHKIMTILEPKKDGNIFIFNF